MDAENKIAPENENGTIGKTLLVDGLGPSLGEENENENVEDCVDSLQVNDVSEDLSKVESLNSSIAEGENSSTAVSESQSSNVVKVCYWKTLYLYRYIAVILSLISVLYTSRIGDR